MRPEATFRDAPRIIVDTCNTCGESFVNCQMVCSPEDYYRYKKALEAK